MKTQLHGMLVFCSAAYSDVWKKASKFCQFLSWKIQRYLMANISTNAVKLRKNL
ncbi:MAG: hypothetical protein WAW41_21560 [Methylobacter sp.]